jgi:outer membrane protein assembly factor BamD (BamD/ComL family)
MAIPHHIPLGRAAKAVSFAVFVGAFLLAGFSRGALPVENERAVNVRADARDLAHRGRIDEAVAKLERVARQFRRTEEGAGCQFDAARLRHLSTDWLGAFEAYQVLMNDFPGSRYNKDAIDAQYRLAEQVVKALKAEGEGKLPVDVGQKLPDKDTTEKMLRLLLVNAGQHERAPAARYLLGIFLQRHGKPEDAIEAFEDVAEKHAGHPLADDAAFQVGMIHWKAMATTKDTRPLTRARLAFQDFLLRHPASDRVAEARHRLALLREKETGEMEKIAGFYEKTGKPAAAAYYREQAANLAATPVVPPDRETLFRQLDEDELVAFEELVLPEDEAEKVMKEVEKTDQAEAPAAGAPPALPNLEDPLPGGESLPPESELPGTPVEKPRKNSP